MSTTKPKEELTRLAWLAALRQQGERQCEGIGNGETACALEVLHEIAFGTRAPYPFPYTAVQRAAGLTYHQVNSVWRMNDGIHSVDRAPHTFSEIADVVSSWFPS